MNKERAGPRILRCGRPSCGETRSEPAREQGASRPAHTEVRAAKLRRRIALSGETERVRAAQPRLGLQERAQKSDCGGAHRLGRPRCGERRLSRSTDMGHSRRCRNKADALRGPAEVSSEFQRSISESNIRTNYLR